MPVSNSAEHEPAPSSWQKLARADRTWPMSPLAIMCRIFCMAGKKRDQTPWTNSRFCDAASSSTSRAASALGAMLFSHRTALPCRNASLESSVWRRDGVAT